MLFQSYIPALVLAHGAVASSQDNHGRPGKSYNHVLRSGHQYSTPQIEVSAASGQANNDVATMIGQASNNNNNTVATTTEQGNSNAMNDEAEAWRISKLEALAKLEAAGTEFSTYFYCEDPEECPPVRPKCEDCGGMTELHHRDVPQFTSTRCSGVSLSFLHPLKLGWLSFD
jgi:hypothetical protein